VESRVFGADEDSQVKFFSYMDSYRNLVSYILVDVIEEEFKQEKIPHLHGKDKATLLNRKMKQFFRNARFRTYLIEGREKKGRRDDKILFSAITNADLLALLLSWIEVHKVPLQGIYSVPYVMASVLRKIGIETKYNLLVSEHADNHLRQTFFDEQELKNSRLSAIYNQSDEENFSLLSREVQKNKRFLNRLQLLPHDENLDVYLMLPHNSGYTAANTSEDSEKQRYHRVDCSIVCEATKLGNNPDTVTTDMLLVHVVCTNSIPANYAQLEERKYFVYRQASICAIAASVIFAFIGLGMSLMNAFQTLDYKERTTLAVKKHNYLTEKHKALVSTRPRYVISAQEMKQAVYAGTKLAQEKLDPVKVFKSMSYHFDQHPKIAINSITWTVKPAKQKLSSRANGSTSQHHPAPKREFGKLYRRIVLDGAVKDFDGNYRTAFVLVNAFIHSIKQDKTFYKINVVKMPIDINSDNRVTGESGVTNNYAHANFRLEFYVRSSNEAR
jgi:hypothetical protein